MPRYWDASDLFKEFTELFTGMMGSIGYEPNQLDIEPPVAGNVRVSVRGQEGSWGLPGHAEYKRRGNLEVEIARYCANWHGENWRELFPRIASEYDRRIEEGWDFRQAVQADDTDRMADITLRNATDGKKEKVVVGPGSKGGKVS